MSLCEMTGAQVTNDTRAPGRRRAQMLRSHAPSPRVAGAGTSVCDGNQEGWMVFLLLRPFSVRRERAVAEAALAD